MYKNVVVDNKNNRYNMERDSLLGLITIRTRKNMNV